VDQQIGAVVVHVAVLDDIIAAKEHAGRDNDQAALLELRNLLRES
jgi:predicted nucleotidyltransferase